MSLYLKWLDNLIAEIDDNYNVKFLGTFTNAVTEAYRGGADTWTSEDFRNVLKERIFSQQRRDINVLLARIGLTSYDVFEIAKRTRAFSLSDKFWIAYAPDEKYETAFLSVFTELYNNKVDQLGDSIASPSGCNQKSYLFNKDGSFGIAKKRLHRFSDDANNEVVVYRLCQLLEIDCCYAEKIDEDTVFSRYQYNINKEYLVHARQLTDGKMLDCSTYDEFVNVMFRDNADNIRRMLLLDFITLQEDRHLSNWAFLFSDTSRERMYSLYDNGRSLLSDADEGLAGKILENPQINSTGIGLVGSYFDIIQMIADDSRISSLINLNITDERLGQCFEGLTGYPQWKIEANIQWINWALSELKKA